ncbi:MAG TPA: M50 family metallopeptidase [Candidatus Nitrosocosmicus sp.]|nr:M50 family metallopeptidase [Candidatus Nitrosocosmicus sp.]
MALSIFIFFIILSILILIHELGHYLVAKKNNVFVEEFGLGLPPRIWGKKIGETLYSINALPFGGFVKLLGEEEHELQGKKLPADLKKRTFASKTHLQKALIIVAGVTMNFILGWGVTSYLLTQGIPVPNNTVLVEQVAKGSPAEQVGLKKGDQIVKVIENDKSSVDIKRPEELILLTKKNAGETLKLQIKRDNNVLEKSLMARKNPPKGQGSLGIALSSGFIEKKYSWYEAPYYGLIQSFTFTKLIAQELLGTLYKFITFQKVNVDVAGPVGIALITNDAVQVGSKAVLQLLSILSFNLAIVNILPFPALDGGRLALIVYEAVTRKKVNTKVEQKLNMIGFAILITLIITITINDIVKLIFK